MTRQLHDQFAKHWLVELLQPVGGKVETQREISGEVYYADVSVEPSPATPVTTFQRLGRLGEMVKQPSLLEHFWNPPTPQEVCDCLLKLFLEQHKSLSAPKPENQPSTARLPDPVLPQLWILTTSASESLLTICDAKPKLFWGPGIYFLADLFKTALVVINRLPTTPDTLSLRILGRGPTQRQALQELVALADTDPNLYQQQLELLRKWGVYIELQPELTEDDQELLMNLDTVYQQWQERTIQEGEQQGWRKGRQEGQREGRREFVTGLLKMRFGVIDEPVIEPLLRLPTEEILGLLAQASHDELLARFSV